jgi:RNA polymerase sigma-70 factor (ECF subfamily)
LRAEDTDLERRIAAAREHGDLLDAATVAIQGYGPSIYAYLRGVLGDPEDAAEVLAQFAENLWRGLGSFRGESSFRTWAYKVAWHAVRNFRRDAFRRRGRRLETSEVSKLPAEAETPTAAQLRSEWEKGLRRIRAHLTAEENALLILRIEREMTWEDIALVLSEPDELLDAVTLRNRFQRVKEKLRKLAAAEGLKIE